MAVNIQHYTDAAKAISSGELCETFADVCDEGVKDFSSELAQRGAVQELAGGDSTVQGLITPAASAGLVSEREKRQEEEKKDRMRRLLEDAYRALLAELSQIREQMGNLTLEIVILTNRINIWERGLKDYREDGEFELNEDGSLKDQELEALIQEQERKTGAAIDRTDAAALYETILEEHQNDTQRKAEAEGEYKILEEQEADVLQRIESINNSEYNPDLQEDNLLEESDDLLSMFNESALGQEKPESTAHNLNQNNSPAKTLTGPGIGS